MDDDDVISNIFGYHGPPNPQPLLEQIKRKYGFAEDFHPDWMLAQIDLAVMWYRVPDPPTHKQVLPAVRRAGRLAAELEASLRAVWPLRLDGDGDLKALQRIQQEAARLAPLIEKAPSRRGRHSSLFEWVARMMVLYQQGTGRTAGYTYDPSSDTYTGPFIGFARDVAAAWGVKATDRTIAKQTQNHLNDPFLLDAICSVPNGGELD